MFGLVLRIKYEEEMLVKEMDGYDDYRKRVKFKLFPKIY
jgi:protein-S-isoprenylcysteine O-methyltransferase Ste14